MSDLDKKTSIPPKVLVVDDNEDVRLLIASLLEDEGYTVVACERGDQAIALVRSEGMDIVLLDRMLPDGDGLEVAQVIKSSQGPEYFIPTLIISALDSEQDKIEGLQVADDYISKPFSNDELVARVRAMLRIRDLQNELYRSQRRYQCLYDNVPEMCVSLNEEERIADCNQSFCRMFDMPRNEAVGKPFLELFTEEERNGLRRYLTEAVNDPNGIAGRQRICKTVRPTSSGEMMVVGVRFAYVNDRYTGVGKIVTMHDLTREMALEREQRIARQQLYRSARMASIGTLASGVAHELNNPLAAILGFSDALVQRFSSDEAGNPEEMKQYLEIVCNEAIRCRDIVDNLSRFARESECRIRPVCLKQCLESAVRLISSRANKRGISIVDSIEPELVVRADPQKLGQVFLNLLTNAVDFSSDGIRVHLTARKLSDRQGRVLVRVDDNGRGMTPEVQQRAFDPFFTTKEVGQGLGLGLAICHRLMEECEGSIDLVSTLDKGTTVFLELPAE